MTAPRISHRHQNRIAGLQEEATAWRRDFHANPEIGFEEARTAKVVEGKLREFGVDEVIVGLGRTGVVGIIRGVRPGPMIGLRADMDALPMTERSDLPWASAAPGRMHACGHDGHMAMLLGAARVLAETRDFAGSVAVIFQPAEEGLGGAREMVADGLFDKADCASVWGLHNWPGMPLGQFGALTGGVMAGIDYFDVTVRGQGAHAGMPHTGTDTVLAAAQLVAAIAAIPGRSVSPHETVTMGVSMFRGSDAYVVMPEDAVIGGSVRWFDAGAREVAERRLRTLARAIAAGYDAEAIVDYRRNYPPTVNAPAETEVAAQVAGALVGEANVVREGDPCMAGEDFSFMLAERPGNYIWMGVDQPGRPSRMVHFPDYDFNDAAIPFGVGYWLGLVDRLLPPA